MSKIQELLRELSKEMPGVGIILIPEDEDVIQTNLSMVKNGSMVMQHMAAFLHLMNNKELYDKVLDSFEQKGRDLKILSNH